MELKIGQRVYFGRGHGEKTLGEIVKINSTRCKVRQLEPRGTSKAHPVGVIWTVPFSLISPVSAAALPYFPAEALLTPMPTDADTAMTAEIERLKAENARLRSQVAQPKRAESEILREIGGVYNRLSPENLFCDGERSRAEASRVAFALNKRLRELFTELGREVSETQAYSVAP